MNKHQQWNYFFDEGFRLGFVCPNTYANNAMADIYGRDWRTS